MRAASRITDDEVAALDRLLELADNELWDLLSGRAEPDDAALRQLLLRDATSRACEPIQVAAQPPTHDAAKMPEGPRLRTEHRRRALAAVGNRHEGWRDDIMTDRTATLTFSDGSPAVTFPILCAARSAPMSSTSARSTARRARSPTTRASCRPPRAIRRSPTSTATRASCSTAAIRSSSSRCKCDFLEVCHLLLYGELPNAGAEEGLRRPRHQAHDGATSRCSSSCAASAATRTRWRC